MSEEGPEKVWEKVDFNKEMQKICMKHGMRCSFSQEIPIFRPFAASCFPFFSEKQKKKINSLFSKYFLNLELVSTVPKGPI